MLLYRKTLAKERSVFMDTVVFTDIVNDMQGAASECVLLDAPLDEAKDLCGTTAGCKLYNVLEETYRTVYVHRMVASGELPTALLKLRDSMIKTDDALSKSLNIVKR